MVEGVSRLDCGETFSRITVKDVRNLRPIASRITPFYARNECQGGVTPWINPLEFLPRSLDVADHVWSLEELVGLLDASVCESADRRSARRCIQRCSPAGIVTVDCGPELLRGGGHRPLSHIPWEIPCPCLRRCRPSAARSPWTTWEPS